MNVESFSNNPDEENVYAVEKIVDERITKDGVRQFKVRWEGYQPKDDTWEPLQNLKNSPLALEEYLKSKRAQVKKNQLKKNKKSQQKKKSSTLKPGTQLKSSQRKSTLKQSSQANKKPILTVIDDDSEQEQKQQQQQIVALNHIPYDKKYYKFSEIVGKRTNEENVDQYQIRWHVITQLKDTWERIQNLQHLSDQIKQYNSKIQRKKKHIIKLPKREKKIKVTKYKKRINGYVVQQIVNKRINVNDGVCEYQIKWKGYSQEQNTWEPIQNLEYVMDMVQQYDKKQLKHGPEANTQIISQSTLRNHVEEPMAHQSELMQLVDDSYPVVNELPKLFDSLIQSEFQQPQFLFFA